MLMVCVRNSSKTCCNLHEAYNKCLCGIHAQVSYILIIIIFYIIFYFSRRSAVAKTISVVASGKNDPFAFASVEPTEWCVRCETEHTVTYYQNKHKRRLPSTPGRVTDAQASQIYGSTTCRGVEITWPDLHLGTFDGVVETFPGLPVHAVSVRRVVTVVVQAVQIGGVASVVPPTAFVRHGTASCRILVVVSVFGAEGPHIMVLQWVTRSSCKRSAQSSTKPNRPAFTKASPQSTELNKSHQCARNNGNWGRAAAGVQHSDINHFTPELKKCILPTFQRENISVR